MKYQSLDALNAAWETRYSSWDEIQRIRWWEVADQPNWTPWFDSRRHLDTLLTERFGADKESIEKIETTGKHFSINPRSLTPFSGMDAYAVIQRLGSSSLYTDFISTGNVGHLELAHGFVRNGVVQSCIGYTWPIAPGRERITREAWFALTIGVRSLAWFAPQCDENPPEGRFSFLDGDLTPNAKGKIIAEVNEQILSGPGKILATSAPIKDGVLVLTSRPSLYAKTLSYLQAERRKSPGRDPATIPGPFENATSIHENSFIVHLRALGYQYEFLDDRELTPERLRTAKAVCLSHIYCLSEEQLRMLAEFARKGGFVLAEAGTALRDGNGRLYVKSPDSFRDLFGIERSQPSLLPVVEPEPLVSVNAQKIASSPGDGDTYRKGSAFFFNHRLKRNDETCDLVREAFAKAGVLPTFRFETNPIQPEANQTGLPVAEVSAFRRDDLTYLVILAEGNAQHDTYRLRFPQPQEMYDVLEQKPLGRRDVIDGSIRYGQVKVFALTSSPVTGMSMRCDRAICRLGDTVKVNISVSAEKGDAGDRVIALTLAPRRDIMPVVPRCAMLNAGRMNLPIHIPLNMAKGSYTLTARDVCSGMTTDMRFAISP